MAPLALALTIVAGAGGLTAHAAPSAARSARTAALSCPTTVLQQTPIYQHVTIYGYAYVMRNLCDGNIFLRVSTNQWGSFVTSQIVAMPNVGGNSAFLAWGGHVDSAEIPYVSGTTYSWWGEISTFSNYTGEGLYTAP